MVVVCCVVPAESYVSSDLKKKTHLSPLCRCDRALHHVHLDRQRVFVKWSRTKNQQDV